ncbi:MAG TPA: hypothetical protein VNS61_05610 [Caldimonas sp.]|nr:hypothetical protein [Caldimonas sp.]
MSNSLDEQRINALRFRSVDMVQKANSSYPGLPLGAAPMAYVLWTRSRSPRLAPNQRGLQ